MEQNNTNNKSNRPDSVRSANSASPLMSMLKNMRDEETKIYEEKNGTQPFIDEIIYECLPELLQTGCNVFTPGRERDVFLTTAITVLSGCFNEVHGNYKDRKVNANLYCFIVALPGNGKGVMNYAKQLANDIHSKLIAQNAAATKKYKDELTRYNAEFKKAKDIAILPAPPTQPETKVLFIPANSSGASMMGLLQQNNGNGIVCETEADTVANSLKQDWGIGSDLLRNAFQHESVSFSRKTNNEYVEISRPQLSIVLTGTPEQVRRLLVSNENGLSSRFIFYSYPPTKVWQDVSSNGTVNLEEHFQILSQEIFSIHSNLKNKNVAFHLTPGQWDRLNKFGANKLAYYSDEVSGSVYRIGLIAFRIAMGLTILRNANSLNDGCKLVCNEDDFFCARILADIYLEHAVHVYDTLLAPRNKPADSYKIRFFEALPGNVAFERKEAVQIGATYSIAERTVNNYLKDFCESELLIKEGYGNYLKT